MSQQFKKGDLVWVHDDEGLDVPDEARGKIGKIVAYVRDADTREVAEYIVDSPQFEKFNAATHHLVKLPSIRMFDSPKNVMGIIHTADPDLHEQIRSISGSHYRLRDVSDATTCFVLMHLGVQALYDNPRILEGSGINEV